MTLRRYLGAFRPHLPWLGVASALLAISAAAPGAAVWLLQQTLDAILAPAGEAGRLDLLTAGLVGVAFLEGAVLLARTRITKGIAWRVTSDLRRRLHRHLLRLSPGQQASTGSRLAALTDEVDELQYGVSALVTAVRNPLTLLILAGTAAWMAPGLVLPALLLVPAVGLTAWAAGAVQRQRAVERREARARLVDLAADQLAGLRTVRAFGAEAQEHARFAEVEEVDRRARLRLEVERVLPSVAVRTVAAAGLGLLLWLGGRQVAAGALQPGELVGFAAALALANRPLGGLGEVWSLLQRSLGALERVEAVLATEPAIAEPEAPLALPPGPLPVRWEGAVADHGEGPVLHAVDLVARPGEILALVGGTGAGKSTLLGLVARGLDPVAGRVTLGGVDVRDLALADLRRAVAVVRQEGFLFARTVRENVTLGRPGAAVAEVRRALEQAGALAFVEALPRGLDTPLDEWGQRLSGGERQRLCLARALLCDAPILLLDEATNQVDALTERALLETLVALRPGRTIVLVAHDLAAAAAADRIAVVAEGRVVEEGSHGALIGRRGAYAELSGVGMAASAGHGGSS